MKSFFFFSLVIGQAVLVIFGSFLFLRNDLNNFHIYFTCFWIFWWNDFRLFNYYYYYYWTIIVRLEISLWNIIKYIRISHYKICKSHIVVIFFLRRFLIIFKSVLPSTRCRSMTKYMTDNFVELVFILIYRAHYSFVLSQWTK